MITQAEQPLNIKITQRQITANDWLSASVYDGKITLAGHTGERKLGLFEHNKTGGKACASSHFDTLHARQTDVLATDPLNKPRRTKTAKAQLSVKLGHRVTKPGNEVSVQPQKAIRRGGLQFHRHLFRGGKPVDWREFAGHRHGFAQQHQISAHHERLVRPGLGELQIDITDALGIWRRQCLDGQFPGQAVNVAEAEIFQTYGAPPFDHDFIDTQRGIPYGGA